MEPIEKRTRLIVAAAVAFALVFSGLFGYLPGNLGFSQTAAALGYEDYFDASSLMRVDVTADVAAWQAMLDSAASEEYIECDIALNGESVSCAGIRCKGNSSLSMTQDERYSFKINFGEYVKKQTFHGLDKMVLNNTQSDNTFIKEYLSYYLLNRAGAKTPLFAMAEIYVNGEYWGLYLAVECIDDSFIERTFSTDGGFLYKPDGTGGMGGGRGDQDNDFSDFTPPDMSDFGNMTPPDGFNMGDNAQSNGTDSDGTPPPDRPANSANSDASTPPNKPNASADSSVQTDGDASDAPTPPGNTQSSGTDPDGTTPPDKPNNSADASAQTDGDASNAPTPPGNAQSDGTASDGTTPPAKPANSADASAQTDGDTSNAPTPPDLPDGDFSGFTPPDGNGGFGGSAQSAAALGYLGDDTSLYGDIFDYAKTNDPSDADKSRLIASLKALSEGALDSALDVDGAISWLAANALLVNDDGYLGSMLHNYYLYELNGKLTILPWDYNLAFGGFAGGSAVSAVNDPVDTPSSSERPLVTALLSDEDCLERYHSALYELATFLTDGSMDDLITELAGMIDESVRNDPTKECTYEDYLTAIKTLRAFCQARGESILGQLDGAIPSTTAGQSEDSSALIQVDFALSDMGAQGGGKGGGGNFGGSRPNFPNGQGGDMPSPPDKASEGASPDSTAAQAADSQSPPDKASNNGTTSTAATGQPTDGDSSNRSASPDKPSNDGTASTASGDTATGQPTDGDSSNRPASPDNPSNNGAASTAPTSQPTDGDSSNRPASPNKPSNDGTTSTAATGQPTVGDSSNRPASPDKPSNDGATSTASGDTTTGQPTDGAAADEAASGNSADSRQSRRAPGGMSFGARSESTATGVSIAQAAILDGAAVIALIAALILITRRRR